MPDDSIRTRPCLAASPRSRVRRGLLTAPLLLLLLLAMASVAGCGGCDSSSSSGIRAAEGESNPQADQEKQKKPSFELKPVVPLLSESIVSADQQEESFPLAKAGHWTSTVQPMRANYNDLDARNTLQLLKGGKPTPLAFTPFHLVSSRPAVLAKGRVKRVVGELFIPENAARRMDVTSQLRIRGSGQVVGPGTEGVESGRPWALMPSYQYFLLVLAADPDAYGFLKLTDTVRSPWEDINSGTYAMHYRVVLADGKKNMPTPSSALNLTTVAFMIWDQADVDRLDAGQKSAIVDWIHWGGRLIINGPDSLATLRGSFLDPYLPVDLGASTSVDEDRLKQLNQYWTQREQGKQGPPIKPTRPWSAVELLPRDPQRDRAVPGTGDLFFERAVGSGSIVVSAFHLTERDFVNWDGFDGFLNAALLRRMPRVFVKGPYVGISSTWASPEGDDANRRLDAHFTTPLRWFARDSGTGANNTQLDESVSDQIGAQFNSIDSYNAPSTMATNPPPTDRSDNQSIDRAGGLGSWSEFNPVADAARSALSVAAGVRVPAASFVVICLSVYLVVLVPLNWMVFRALGRVEWAWIAAPLIALAGTILVVQQAQLDIGFVRSQTEIALLELQKGYPRGHLTRFTALYTSLSTTYELQFDDPSAVATPFPADDQFKLAIGDPVHAVWFEKYDDTRLSGLPVTSASTRFVHSEQMVPLGGGLRTTLSTNGLRQLENKTGLDLADAMLLRRELGRNGEPTYSAAWVGQLAGGGAVLMPGLRPISLTGKDLPFAKERQTAAAVDPQNRLDVDELLRLAMQFPPESDPYFGQRDETRLVARIDGMLPGAVASPAASQTAGVTVVLAHVDFPGDLPQPQPDVNSAEDVLPDGRPAVDEGDLLDGWLEGRQGAPNSPATDPATGAAAP